MGQETPINLIQEQNANSAQKGSSWPAGSHQEPSCWEVVVLTTEPRHDVHFVNYDPSWYKIGDKRGNTSEHAQSKMAADKMPNFRLQNRVQKQSFLYRLIVMNLKHQINKNQGISSFT